jgi:hypothetical protein
MVYHSSPLLPSPFGSNGVVVISSILYRPSTTLLQGKK